MVAQMITRRFPFIRRGRRKRGPYGDTHGRDTPDPDGGRRKRGPYVRLFLVRLVAFKNCLLARM
jgi:hypothetical protein